MKSFNIQSTFTIADSIKEVPEHFKELIDLAEVAKEKAYSPYSKYCVGASLRLKSGEVFSANNQENAAYPSGLCAERNCLFSAKAASPQGIIEYMAVVASPCGVSELESVTPCGACRQVMIEYESIQKFPIQIVFSWKAGQYLIAPSAETFLPLPFSPLNLGSQKAVDE